MTAALCDGARVRTLARPSLRHIGVGNRRAPTTLTRSEREPRVRRGTSRWGRSQAASRRASSPTGGRVISTHLAWGDETATVVETSPAMRTGGGVQLSTGVPPTVGGARCGPSSLAHRRPRRRRVPHSPLIAARRWLASRRRCDARVIPIANSSDTAQGYNGGVPGDWSKHRKAEEEGSPLKIMQAVCKRTLVLAHRPATFSCSRLVRADTATGYAFVCDCVIAEEKAHRRYCPCLLHFSSNSNNAAL